MNEPAKKGRPVGVLVLIFWQLLEGGVGILVTTTVASKMESVSLTGLILTFSLIPFVAAYGLWGLRGWAWYLTLILAVLSVPRGIIGLFSGDILMVLRIAIYAGIIGYLMGDETKKLFFFKESWLKDLNDQDEKARIRAAVRLGEIKDVRAINPLIAVLNHADVDVQVRATRLLARIGVAAIPLLLRELRDFDPRSREAAARTLGYMKHVDAVEPLIEALKDGSEEVRKQAERGLKRFTGENLGQSYQSWQSWWGENK